MAVIETWFNQDLQNAVKVQYLDGNVFSQDNSGNLVGVNVFDGGEPATLVGTVSGSVIRADGATVAISGTRSDNKCYIILPQAVYAVPGVVSIVIKLTDGTTVTTLCAVVANVYQSSTDTVVDPGTIIPSVENLIEEIQNAIDSIPADYSALISAVASVYSSSSSYKPGAIVWHEGVLYKCTTAIPSSESWNSSHWATVHLADEMFLDAMMFRGRDSNVTDSRMLKQIGCHNVNTSWYTDLTTDFGSGKLGALICFGNPVNSQIYHVLYFETGEMYARWVHKTNASAGAWIQINTQTDWTNVLNLKSAGSETDAKKLPVGFYNCNTSWFTDMESELGAGKIGALFVYGNPSYQHYQLFTQETGDIYFRWVNSAGTSAGAFIHVAKSFARTNRYFSFGDSRVYGYIANSGSQSQYRYPKFIADQMGMSYSNYAISGSGLFARNDHPAAIDVVQGVTSLSEATLITIEWGVNDYLQPLGTYEDTGDTTWCGRLYQLISYIMETAPNACLVVIGSANTAEGTFANGWGYGVTTQGGAWSLGKLIDEEAKLCAKYHIPFISGYDCPINSFNIEGLMPDDLHYLDQGYLMRSRYLYGKVREFFGVNVPEVHSGA